MVIEYNKDLYIEVLRDEIILTREELEKARNKAVTDDKTALFNHRYLQSRLDAELKRAQRYGRELTVLMLDIDDFSKVNNAYGHDIGDKVLFDAAKVLVRSCRDIDIITRFGGDEFTVIMPDTDVFGARILADRMMKEAKDFRFDTGHGFKASITISIGIATYPGHGKNAEELMQSADRALLRAKEKGKDRCVMAVAARD